MKTGSPLLLLAARFSYAGHLSDGESLTTGMEVLATRKNSDRPEDSHGGRAIVTRDGTRRQRASLALKIFAIALAAVPALAGRPASAQIEARPQWAVLEFANKGPKSMTVGKMATDAFSAELTRLDKVDVAPAESVDRQTADLGYQPPVTKPADIQRLGQALQVVTVISGEVVNWRIVTTPQGRQAQVLLRTMVWDVASGLTVNGAAIGAQSDVRSGDISDEDLIKSALSQGAYEAMSQISSRTLPTATVLNTLNNRALINRGNRAGFAKDQRVIVNRGKSQVAEGVVRDVDPDSSFMEVTRSYRGIQPGDQVRVIFDVPNIKDSFGKDGSVQPKRSTGGGNNSGLVSLVIVLLILGFLLSGGHATNQDGVANVTAEALVLSNDVPAVKISWTRDSFFRGTDLGPYQFQVWRNDYNTAPAVVATANQSFAYNDRDGNSPTTWYDFGGIIGGDTCDNTTPPAGGGNAGATSSPGTPYYYSVEVVYRVSCLDLPGGCTGGTTGGTTGTTGGTTGTTGGTTGLTTGGTTGGTTGTTGGTTGTTGTTSGTTGTVSYCYFVTAKVAAVGQATPLSRSNLRSPDDNAIVSAPTTFTFTSVRGAVASVPLEYVVQFSDLPSFPRGSRTFTTDSFVELVLPGGQPVSSPTIDTSTVDPTATVIYWRVGVRNPEDVPGPVADANGQRYVWSSVRHFRRPSNP